MRPLVSVTSDFGTSGGYAGAMAGAVLEACPQAQIVVVTHDVPAHDVLAGAFAVVSAAPWFPSGTVHLAVVDPGVGTSRRGLVVETARHVYVGPDNGLLGLILEREPIVAVRSIENRALGRATIHPTFHGRDLFGPVAGRLAAGLAPSDVGPAIVDPVRLPLSRPRRIGDDLVVAILHVDRFGNATTNLAADELTALAGDAELSLAGAPLRVVSTYADARPGETVALVGSAGYLEVARDRESAAHALDVRAGDPLTLRLTRSERPRRSDG